MCVKILISLDKTRALRILDGCVTLWFIDFDKMIKKLEREVWVVGIQ